MMRANRTRAASLRLACVAGAAALMGACASPEPTLHTLSLRAEPPAPETARIQRAFRLSGVRVPERLDKPQIVLRTSDSQVQELEQQRWAAPFGAELRDALSADLADALSAVDVGGATPPAGVPLYRIGADVQRLDARPGQDVSALVTWRVSRDAATPGSGSNSNSNSNSALTCQTTLAEPAGGEVDAVVAATQRVVRQWSQRVAESVHSLEAPGKGLPAWCR
ncbi:membrane integrity-associated transporter subunit PqiC, partial [Ralstonia solanacearum]|uniref:PqiC family protein n=2 Tax=Ralstonia solanacearum TaxID=305 RepID=UPI00070DFCB8|nr:ABC-type transport auxiliary lipoprotein family protein [Ralstonia solanacearum]MBB6591930.1 membrane integrity-associated transporter subunit PqiC [Ralstonia solanacearum]MDB0553841.1 ABC-type transport auxiliary lipoprotein family protein [Ralstonia solanacearum]